MKRYLIAFVVVAATASTASAETVLPIALQAARGQFVAAEWFGPFYWHYPSLWANRSEARDWETFFVVDKNDGDLRSGDRVELFAHNGYLTTTPEGHLRTGFAPWDRREFYVWKTSGGGPIVYGDKFAVCAWQGRWNCITAVDGGGRQIGTYGVSWLGEYETFTMARPDNYLRDRAEQQRIAAEIKAKASTDPTPAAIATLATPQKVPVASADAVRNLGVPVVTADRATITRLTGFTDIGSGVFLTNSAPLVGNNSGGLISNNATKLINDGGAVFLTQGAP